jgi:hypothetical protein
MSRKKSEKQKNSLLLADKKGLTIKNPVFLLKITDF